MSLSRHKLLAVFAAASSAIFLSVLNSGFANQSPLSGGETKLTDNAVQDFHPSWTPNSQNVVFDRTAEDGPRVYVASINNGLQKPLAAGDHPHWLSTDKGLVYLNSETTPGYPAGSYLLSFGAAKPSMIVEGYSGAFPSPDGRRVAYVSNVDGDWELWVVDLVGDKRVRITDNAADEFAPSWSPDGRKVAFMSNQTGEWNIFVADVVTAETHQLTDEKGLHTAPLWSPDGKWISYFSETENGSDLYLATPDGEEKSRLTFNGAKNWQAWSADASRIVFAAERNVGENLFVIELEGRRTTPLTNNNARNVAPAWSPDNRHIAYASDRDGDMEIYVAKAPRR
ncbi:hypothetical protein [Hyphococcus sp.]|uniref:hypothetical protein n=1 Tax=Hyphococcus sp. TaxID=2038636 RepID=UPI003CCC3568